MKRQHIPFLFLLFCMASRLLLYLTNGPADITLQNAVEDGFPIYLPSANLLQSMEITNEPVITRERDDRICTYLNVDLYRENVMGTIDEKPALHMIVSNGCAYPLATGFPTELSWAVGGRAMRLGDDLVDQLPPIIYFHEPTRQFQYVVYSEETLDHTMKLLESMTLVR